MGAIVAANYGRPPVEVTMATSYAVVLVVLAWIDLRVRVVPNAIVLPAIAIALLAATAGAGPSPGIAFLGGIVASGPFVLLFLVASPGAIGAGDVKMAGLVGAIAGVPDVFGPMLLATVTAAVVAGILRAGRTSGRERLMPYGPFLALGGVSTLL